MNFDKSLDRSEKFNFDFSKYDELEIEKALKDLLETIISYLEKFIKTQDEVTIIEEKLHDYENMTELIQINKDIFTYLSNKIDTKIATYKGLVQKNGANENQTMSMDEMSQMETDYDKLEKIMQKCEGEIRNHIRIEQQLKLYSEQLQTEATKAKEEKSSVEEQLKKEIEESNKRNTELQETFKQHNEQIEALKQQIVVQEENLQLYHKYFTFLESFNAKKSKSRKNSARQKATPSPNKTAQGNNILGQTIEKYLNQKILLANYKVMEEQMNFRRSSLTPQLSERQKMPSSAINFTNQTKTDIKSGTSRSREKKDKKHISVQCKENGKMKHQLYKTQTTSSIKEKKQSQSITAIQPQGLSKFLKPQTVLGTTYNNFSLSNFVPANDNESQKIQQKNVSNMIPQNKQIYKLLINSKINTNQQYLLTQPQKQLIIQQLEQHQQQPKPYMDNQKLCGNVMKQTRSKSQNQISQTLKPDFSQQLNLPQQPSSQRKSNINNLKKL